MQRTKPSPAGRSAPVTSRLAIVRFALVNAVQLPMPVVEGQYSQWTYGTGDPAAQQLARSKSSSLVSDVPSEVVACALTVHSE